MLLHGLGSQGSQALIMSYYADPRDSAAALHSGQDIGNMLSAEAIVESGTVPPSGGGNDRLISASISFECGGPALDLLPCFTVSHVRRGPGGVKPESHDSCGNRPAKPSSSLSLFASVSWRGLDGSS